MEKIEERLGLCKHCLTDETRFCHTDCHLYSKYKGAEEQKAIDDAYFADASKIVIDKAWRWIELYRNMEVHWTLEQMEEHFRKDMEE